MKVFFDARAVRHSMTGVGVYTRSLLKALMRIDRENEYCCFITEEDAWASLEASENFQPCFDAPDYQSHPAGDWWLRFKLPRLLEKEKADLFHGPAFLCPNRGSTPTIVTIHDMTVFLHPETYTLRFRKYLQWAIRSSVRGADSVIAVSESTQRDVNRLLKTPIDRIWIVWEAPDEQFHSRSQNVVDEFLKEKNLSPEFILAVGTIEPRKGLDTLISAFRMLPEELQEKHPLVIIGDYGWKSDALKRRIEKEINIGRIRRIGYVDTHELPLYYNAAIMLAYPSIYEGFGLPPLEAMACGAPVLASDISSLPEVVSDAGLLAPPNKPERWANEIEGLLTNASLRENLSRHGVERAKHFTWEKTARKTLECYQATIASCKS